MIRRRILQKKLRPYVSGQRASLQSIYIEECCVKQMILFYSDNDSKKNSPEETKALCFRAESFLTEYIYIEECCVKQMILFYSDNDS